MIGALSLPRRSDFSRSTALGPDGLEFLMKPCRETRTRRAPGREAARLRAVATRVVLANTACSDCAAATFPPNRASLRYLNWVSFPPSSRGVGGWCAGPLRGVCGKGPLCRPQYGPCTVVRQPQVLIVEDAIVRKRVVRVQQPGLVGLSRGIWFVLTSAAKSIVVEGFRISLRRELQRPNLLRARS